MDIISSCDISEYVYIPDAEQTTISIPDSAADDADAASMTAAGVVISESDRKVSTNTEGSSPEESDSSGIVYELVVKNGTDGRCASYSIKIKVY